MHKKIPAIIMAAFLLLCAPISAPADENLIINGSLEEIAGDSISGGQFGGLSGITIDSLSAAHDGFNSIRMPDNNGSFQINIAGITGNANYIFTFWSKTSVASSVQINMYSYVSHAGYWYTYGEYCEEAGIPYIGNGEDSMEWSIGTAAASGTPIWEKNSIEVRIPQCVTNLVFSIKAVNTADAARAFDSFSLVKTADNLVRNGTFDESCSTVPSSYNPGQYRRASNWQVHPGDHFDGHFNYVDVEENRYVILEDSGNSQNQWRGMVLRQMVYLYEGIYKLSYSRCNFTASGNIVQLMTGKDNYSILRGTGEATLTTVHNVMNKSNYTTSGFASYDVYFEVTKKGSFTLSFGNIWQPGKFACDNVKLMPVTTTEIEYATDYTTYHDTAKNITDVQKTAVESIPYGKTVYAHGAFAANANAKVITVLYKADSTGKSICDMKIMPIVATEDKVQLFICEGIAVPDQIGTETYSIKTFVWEGYPATVFYGHAAVLR